MAITKVSSGVISANAVTATIVAENVITSSEIATDGVGTLQIANDAVTSAKLDTNIDIAGTLDVTGVLTADSNVVIAGNLTVNGSTVTNSSTNTTIEDALIELGTGTTGTPANDAGIIIERGDSNNAFIGFDESADKFIVATTTATGSSTGDLTLTAAPLVTGALTASGLAYPTSDGSANQVIKTDGSGNLSFVTAITDGAVVHNYTATGDGSTATFDTGINPQDEVNTWVHIDGVYQNKSEYSYNGTSITFTSAPDSGAAIDIITGNQNGFSTADSVLGIYSATTTDTATYDTGLSASTENNVNIFIEGVYQPKSTYTWSGSTITFDANTPTGLALEVIASKTLTSGAVVTASITDSAVTTAKIADNAITSAKIVNNSITGADISATTNIVASTFTGALTGNVTGNVTGNLTGTIQTAAQPNITSVGTLTALTGGTGDLNWDSGTLFVDSSANAVGIGTTSPGHKLSFGTYVPSDGKTITVYESGNIASGIGVVSGVYRNFTDETSALSFGHYAHSDGTTYSEKMRIDSSGNVGIGVTPTDYYSGGDNLVVNAGTGEGGITIAGASNQWNYLLFADGTSGDAQYRGQIAYNHTTDQLALTASGYVTILTGSSRSEKVRIDSSGNLLVGQQTASSGTVGTSLRADGRTFFCADGNYAAHFNRNTSDGVITHFAKNDNIVGSIGVEGGDSLYVQGGTTSGSGLLYHGTVGKVLPARNSTSVDAIIDLGQSTRRFKDLYLSGGVYLGGTGAANHLDDYEEGTWSPQVYYQNSTDQANATNVVQDGKYIKIGKLVFLQWRLDFSQSSSSPANDNIGVKNLPFSGANNHYAGGGNVIASTTQTALNWQIPQAGSTVLVLTDSTNVGNFGDEFGTGSNKYMRGSITYIAQ